MYQAQITDTETGTPVTFGSTVADIARALGGRSLESVDAKQGIWLIDLNDYNETRLEQDGYLGISINGCTVEIELP
jgi:hypothetical protein